MDSEPCPLLAPPHLPFLIPLTCTPSPLPAAFEVLAHHFSHRSIPQEPPRIINSLCSPGACPGLRDVTAVSPAWLVAVPRGGGAGSADALGGRRGCLDHLHRAWMEGMLLSVCLSVCPPACPSAVPQRWGLHEVTPLQPPCKVFRGGINPHTSQHVGDVAEPVQPP